MCIGHHELDTVDLVHVGCTGVIIDSHDISSRELLTDGFHELIVSRMTDGIRKEESVIRLVSKKKNWNAMFFGNNTSLPRFNSS